MTQPTMNALARPDGAAWTRVLCAVLLLLMGAGG